MSKRRVFGGVVKRGHLDKPRPLYLAQSPVTWLELADLFHSLEGRLVQVTVEVLDDAQPAASGEREGGEGDDFEIGAGHG